MRWDLFLFSGVFISKLLFVFSDQICSFHENYVCGWTIKKWSCRIVKEISRSGKARSSIKTLQLKENVVNSFSPCIKFNFYRFIIARLLTIDAILHLWLVRELKEVNFIYCEEVERLWAHWWQDLKILYVWNSNNILLKSIQARLKLETHRVALHRAIDPTMSHLTALHFLALHPS